MDKCVLCRSEETVEYIHGELYETENVKAHSFCLLFAPNLPQKGKDDEGMEGFLLRDIQKEEVRVRRLKCCYCKKMHANLGCSIRECKKAFHTECGYKNKVSFEFTSQFPCFCVDHSTNNQTSSPSNDDVCSICSQNFNENDRNILMPCCKHTWFHHSCIQTFAQTAGLYFKCPNCNDQEKCFQLLPKFGVHVYEKDADWEIEYDNLEDFETIPEQPCESDNCNGTPETSYSVAPWLWDVCEYCGSCAVHKECRNATNEPSFTCTCCTESLVLLNRCEAESFVEDYLNEEASTSSESSTPKADKSTYDSSIEKLIKRFPPKNLETEDSENSDKENGSNYKENENLKLLSQVAVSMEVSNTTSGVSSTPKISEGSNFTSVTSVIDKVIKNFQDKNKEILEALESENSDKENENLKVPCQGAVAMKISDPKESTFTITSNESFDEDYNSSLEMLIKTLEGDGSENSNKENENLKLLSQVAVSIEDSDVATGESSTPQASDESSYSSVINRAVKKVLQPKTEEIRERLDEGIDKKNDTLNLFCQVPVSMETSDTKDSTFTITNDKSSKKVKFLIDEKSSESTSQDFLSSSAFQGVSSIISSGESSNYKKPEENKVPEKTESSVRGIKRTRTRDLPKFFKRLQRFDSQ
ncbi:CLUMA_CG011717, isoform A [Clunio marinus]|uniref:CLUMA_CG011717, isoform A n=1 Tax=Clunio marinus TaxID=568069 RepID=A0A1J1IDL4_9DIPT|nr:CLUMA_CG011717, isoform A [Clunio marinus]